MLHCIFLALLLHPSLSQTLDYVCTTRQEVKILKIGLERYKWMYAAGVRGGLSSQPCDVTKASDTTVGYDAKFIITNCELASPIQVTITEALEDKTIIGGKGASGFEIKCNGILEGGENITLIQTVMSKDTDFRKVHHLMADPKMVIRSRNGTVLPDRSTVLIGDELSVIISTAQNFSFTVISCEAHNENQKDRKLLFQNEIVVDPSLLTAFVYTNGNRSYAEARLFAFHFVNSDHLQLSCVIFVCRKSDTTCAGRHARNAPSENEAFSPFSEPLQANFIVYSGSSGANPINGPCLSCVLVPALALLASYCRL
ncbi:hypothetical protein CHS0354_023172 [Potamilus streckersoni]|uniref:ZP domain-containing protein n=1 Tax=Potamilus streckersoni TaxID=2493646 RepID=A0AAE0TAW1_9BIVA|nr:hypothetical protein CHS0354_023172 [Potamilus streckersoni]